MDNAVEPMVSHSGVRSAPSTWSPQRTSAYAKLGSAGPVHLRLEGGVALARIDLFTRGTGTLFRGELASAVAKGPLRGVILDLRDNPGGVIAAAVEVASVFLPPDTPVLEEKAQSGERSIVSRDLLPHLDWPLPVVVLVNNGTASAAEIVAVALQDNRRAVVVGSASFGKGTVQRIFDLDNGGELWLTSMYSRAPSGYYLQGHGVLPDICTSLPIFDAAAPASLRIRMWRYQSLLSRPRSSLDEVAWRELRSLCPTAISIVGRDRDLDLALELIGSQAQNRQN